MKAELVEQARALVDNYTEEAVNALLIAYYKDQEETAKAAVHQPTTK
jgi:hypothetical protein